MLSLLPQYIYYLGLFVHILVLKKQGKSKMKFLEVEQKLLEKQLNFCI